MVEGKISWADEIWDNFIEQIIFSFDFEIEEQFSITRTLEEKDDVLLIWVEAKLPLEMDRDFGFLL